VDDVLDFLCIVTSGPKKFEHRNAIRNTWGQVMMKQTDVKMKVIFLIGLTHNQEVNDQTKGSWVYICITLLSQGYRLMKKNDYFQASFCHF
jgi:hypothetical protein